MFSCTLREKTAKLFVISSPWYIALVLHKKLMCIVFHWWWFYIISLFFCCQIFLECFQIFIIVNSTVVDIFVSVLHICEFLWGHKYVIAGLQNVSAFNPRLVSSFTRECHLALHSRQFAFPLQCVIDLIDLHLLQYLVLSNVWVFAHLLGVKWYAFVSSFSAAFPWLQWGWISSHRSVGLLGCCFCELPIHRIARLLSWWWQWDSGAEKWIDHKP